jgi:hypothetical protein
MSSSHLLKARAWLLLNKRGSWARIEFKNPTEKKKVRGPIIHPEEEEEGESASLTLPKYLRVRERKNLSSLSIFT